MDHQIFLAINNLVGKSAVLDKIGAFVGGDYFLYLIVLIVVLLLSNRRLRPKVYLALVSGAVGYLFTYILKQLISRPRPFQVLQVHQLIIDNERGNSFPSGHATFYFAVAFAFWGTDYFWPFFTAAVIGSLGRVFVGVHFPLDILAGAVIGGLTVWILNRLFKKQLR